MENIQFTTSYAKKFADANDIDGLKKYIQQFFYSHTGDIFFRDKNRYILIDLVCAKKKLPNDLIVYKTIGKKTVEAFNARNYLESTEFREKEYMQTIDFSKDEIFTKTETIRNVPIELNYINMAKPLANLDFNKKINKKKVKDGLNAVYNHILNIWCSKNAELNEWILNFLACTLNGRKVRKILYSQCTERCGRGIIISFIQSILGEAMYKTSSIEEITLYTKNFEGCLFVNFDELPVSNENFKPINDKLKILSTENDFTCREMHQSPYKQINTFNTMITTNNDAIHFAQNNKERYVCTEVDESIIGDTQYFSALKKFTDDEDVKIAFYQEMKERFSRIHDWNEDITPMTTTKKNKIIESLPMLYKYIKDKYILKRVDLKSKTNIFLEEYTTTTKDRATKQRLGRDLKRIGIVPRKLANGSYIYEKTHKELRAVFEKNLWIDDLNDVDIVDDSDCEEDVNDCEYGIEKKDDDVALLKKQLQEALNTIKELKEDKPKETAPKKKVKKVDDDYVEIPSVFRQNIYNILVQSQPESKKSKKERVSIAKEQAVSKKDIERCLNFDFN
jgi:hypothetical protein